MMCIAVKRGMVILLVVFIIVHTICWYSNKFDPLGPLFRLLTYTTIFHSFTPMSFKPELIHCLAILVTKKADLTVWKLL